MKDLWNILARSARYACTLLGHRLITENKEKVAVVRFMNVKNITARPFGFDIVVVASVRDAVAGADIITTSTTNKAQAAGRTHYD